VEDGSRDATRLLGLDGLAVERVARSVGDHDRSTGDGRPGRGAAVAVSQPGVPRRTFTEQVAQVPAECAPRPGCAALASAVADRHDQSEVAATFVVSWPTVRASCSDAGRRTRPAAPADGRPFTVAFGTTRRMNWDATASGQTRTPAHNK